MGDIDEGDAELAVHLLEFYLHVLSHLQVEGCKRFVKKENLRLVHNCACDSYTLLLTARK